MDAGILVPLAFFAAVILVVALIVFARVRDHEAETQQTLGRAEAEHRLRVAELDEALQRLRGENSWKTEAGENGHGARRPANRLAE